MQDTIVFLGRQVQHRINALQAQQVHQDQIRLMIAYLSAQQKSAMVRIMTVMVRLMKDLIKMGMESQIALITALTFQIRYKKTAMVDV
jgi:hypothetical protein